MTGGRAQCESGGGGGVTSGRSERGGEGSDVKPPQTLLWDTFHLFMF